jgi:hypothetical protein
MTVKEAQSLASKFVKPRPSITTPGAPLPRNPNGGSGTHPRRSFRYHTPEEAAEARRVYRRVYMQQLRSQLTENAK